MRSGNYEGSGSGVGTAITFLLIGLGVGAAVGLLLAPKAGKQLRKNLRRSYGDARDSVSDFAEGAKERFADVVEKSSDFADQVRSKSQPLSDLLRRR
jgi:gas vesicle protein